MLVGCLPPLAPGVIHSQLFQRNNTETKAKKIDRMQNANASCLGIRTFKKFEQEVNKLFSTNNISQLAKESDFIQRSRKVSAVSLLESVLFCNPDNSKVSLNDLAIYHKINFGVTLTRQAIKNRFTANATSFVKKLLAQMLMSNLSTSREIFTHSCFNRIRIKDSTCNQLPENMEKVYPGSGGSGSKAAVRIQFEYDLKNLDVLELSASAFNNQDLKNAKDTVTNIQNDDLIIRDLGYVSVETMQDIEQQQAWYVFRLNHGTNVKECDTGRELDFSEIEKYNRRHNINIMEKTVFLTGKNYPCRLIIEIVPEKVKQERTRKREWLNKKKGRKASKESLARAGLNLFVTNCTAIMLSASEIRKIYGIRWQVEVVFKAWKQNSQMHKVKKMDINRFEFLLYAKLVWIMLHWKTCQVLDISMADNRRGRISILKTYKTLSQFHAFTKSIIRGLNDKIKELLEWLMEMSATFLKHEDRKDRINWRNVEII
jgi:hypothetical protein